MDTGSTQLRLDFLELLLLGTILTISTLRKERVAFSCSLVSLRTAPVNWRKTTSLPNLLGGRIVCVRRPFTSGLVGPGSPPEEGTFGLFGRWRRLAEVGIEGSRFVQKVLWNLALLLPLDRVLVVQTLTAFVWLARNASRSIKGRCSVFARTCDVQILR